MRFVFACVQAPVEIIFEAPIARRAAIRGGALPPPPAWVPGPGRAPRPDRGPPGLPAQRSLHRRITTTVGDRHLPRELIDDRRTKAGPRSAPNGDLPRRRRGPSPKRSPRPHRSPTPRCSPTPQRLATHKARFKRRSPLLRLSQPNPRRVKKVVKQVKSNFMTFTISFESLHRNCRHLKDSERPLKETDILD